MPMKKSAARDMCHQADAIRLIVVGRDDAMAIDILQKQAVELLSSDIGIDAHWARNPDGSWSKTLILDR